MKRILLTMAIPMAMVASACGSGTAPAASAPASTENFVQELTKLENDRVAALLGSDVAFIEQVYADDYVVTGANGVVRTRDQVVSDMKSGAQTFEAMAIRDIKVRAYGDTAIVTGRTTQKGQYKGEPSLSPTTFTRVYVKGAGQWRLVANSSSVYSEVE